MNPKARVSMAVAIAACLMTASLMPVRFKVALGISARARVIDLVPYAPLDRIIGPIVIINPHALAHFAVFAISTVLLLMQTSRMGYRYAVIFCLGILALGTETAEHLMYNNQFEWQDVGLDFCATALAAAFTFLLRGPGRPVTTSAFPQR